MEDNRKTISIGDRDGKLSEVSAIFGHPVPVSVLEQVGEVHASAVTEFDELFPGCGHGCIHALVTPIPTIGEAEVGGFSKAGQVSEGDQIHHLSFGRVVITKPLSNPGEVAIIVAVDGENFFVWKNDSDLRTSCHPGGVTFLNLTLSV